MEVQGDKGRGEKNQILNINNIHSLQELDLGAVFLKPTVEGENGQQEVFLPADPIDLITQGKFHKVPFLTGVTSSEGLISLRGRTLVVTHVLQPRTEQPGFFQKWQS